MTHKTMKSNINIGHDRAELANDYIGTQAGILNRCLVFSWTRSVFKTAGESRS